MQDFFIYGSIGLGLIAWIIPIIFSIKKKEIKVYGIYAIGSFTACAVSIGLQIFEIRRLVDIEEFSTLMDTMKALSIVVAVFIIITVALNVQSYSRARNK